MDKINLQKLAASLSELQQEAKALWGERQTRPLTEEEKAEFMGSSNGVYVTVSKGWQYHLQQMVITPDPIAYLAKHTAGDASLSTDQGQESP